MDGLILDYLKEKIPFLACIAVLIALSICAGVITHFKNKIKELAVQRKCIFQIAVTAVIVLAILLLLYFSNKIDIWIIATVCPALLLACFVIWWFTFHLPPLAYFYIRKYKKLYQKGYVFEKLEEIRKRPCFIVTVTGKLKFAVIQYGYFIWASDFKSAYEVLFEVSKLNLLDKERSGINSRITFTLYRLGAFSAAREKYASIDKPSATDESVLSMLYEEDGDFEEAEKIISSLNSKMLSSEISLDDKGVISNNFGRTYRLKNNNIGAVKLYRDAINYAVERKDIYNLLLSYSNLILTLSAFDVDAAKQEYAKYLEIVKKEPFTMYKFQEYANLKLMLSERLNDWQAINSIINEVIDRSNTVDTTYKINLLIMTAKIIANNRLDITETMLRLIGLQNDIFSAPMPERYNWIKELHFIFLQMGLYPGSKFQLLKDRVESYMHQKALSDVDAYITDLPQYAVNETIHFIRDRIYLKKLAANYSFYDVRRDFDQLADICGSNSLGFGRMTAFLNIINEAYDAHNIECVTNGVPKSKYDKEVKEVLPTVQKMAKKFMRHPGIADVYLQLCLYCICDGNLDAAKDYMNAFEELNISLNRFGFYIKQQYALCKRILKQSSDEKPTEPVEEQKTEEGGEQ